MEVDPSKNTQTDSKGIPVIDLAHPNAAIRLVEVFKTVGFACVVNHDVDPLVVQAAFAASKSFFQLPDETKRKYGYQGHDSNRGYIAMGSEKHESEEFSDRKESFDIGKEDEPGFLTPWPSELDHTSFRGPLLKYFAEFNRVFLHLMELIAVGLGIDPDYFSSRSDEEHINLRLLHYPPIDNSDGEMFKRSAPHTDFSALTLLTQDSVGGLRVQRRDGTWTHVQPIEGAIVINVGDMLQRWTNDVLWATPHHVVEPPNVRDMPERYSIAFFCSANKGVTIECLSEMSEKPANYPPIDANDYLMKRLSDTIRARSDEGSGRTNCL